METVTVLGAPGGTDPDGYPLPGGEDRDIEVRRVQPVSQQELADTDRDGTLDVLRVWTDQGSGVTAGDQVRVRGLVYKVVRTPWDRSRNRRPVLSLHRPSVVFEVERGQA